MVRYTLPLLASVLAISGCGGGGSDSGFIGAALVEIRTSPGKIDTGDRSEVRIRISEIHPAGIVLKIRYPSELAYVTESAVLEVNDRDTDASPEANRTVDSSTYLVFELSEDDLGSKGEGELRFQLQGNAAVEDGEVEVDADVDTGANFDPDNPEFGAEDAAGLEVTE